MTSKGEFFRDPDLQQAMHYAQLRGDALWQWTSQKLFKIFNINLQCLKNKKNALNI